MKLQKTLNSNDPRSRSYQIKLMRGDVTKQCGKLIAQTLSQALLQALNKSLAVLGLDTTLPNESLHEHTQSSYMSLEAGLKPRN